MTCIRSLHLCVEFYNISMPEFYAERSLDVDLYKRYVYILPIELQVNRLVKVFIAVGEFLQVCAR